MLAYINASKLLISERNTKLQFPVACRFRHSDSRLPTPDYFHHKKTLAHSSFEEIALTCDADVFLAKPFDIKQLNYNG